MVRQQSISEGSRMIEVRSDEEVSRRKNSRPRAVPNGRRMLIFLSSADYRALVVAAAGAGLRPRELLQRMVSQSLAPGGGFRSLEVELIGQRIERIEGELHRQSNVLRRLGGSASTPARVAKGRTGAAEGQPDDGEVPRARLHEEIVAVLKETNGPLTSAQITDQIRQRGRFEPPRSKRPLDVVMVASRISHENYRHLFKREGSFVRLAGDGRRSRGKSS